MPHADTVESSKVVYEQSVAVSLTVQVTATG